MKRTLLIGSLVLGLLVMGEAARAKRLHHHAAPKPMELRLEGYLGPKRSDVISEADWRVSCRGKEYAFHATHVRVLTGDLNPSNIIDDRRPYRLAFVLQGPEELLAQFTKSPPGKLLALMAFSRFGSRELMVSRVEPVAEGTPTAAP